MNELKEKSVVENDIILVYIEDKPTFFARIESITADIKRGWWRVKLLILQVPLIVTTWILDNDQICGADFTMGGTPMRIEKVVAPEEAQKNDTLSQDESVENEQNNQRARIFSLKKSDDGSTD